jgi:hypothetical protein
MGGSTVRIYARLARASVLVSLIVAAAFAAGWKWG